MDYYYYYLLTSRLLNIMATTAIHAEIKTASQPSWVTILQTNIWLSLIFPKVCNEHPSHFYMGVPSPGGGGGGVQVPRIPSTLCTYVYALNPLG